jgi:flagellar protein FliO/FliZ
LAPNWGSLAWFGVIVALIPLALWLLKRTPVARSGGGGLRLVSALPLSASSRVAIVEVGAGDERRWLVLGVGPQGVQTLHTLPPQEPALPAGAGPASPFAQVLARTRGAK